MGLRQSLYREAQHLVSQIVHKLFEEDFLTVGEEAKASAKKIIADAVHGARRRLEKEFCKED